MTSALLHGLVGRQMLPRVGAEMVAAEDEARRVEADRRGDLLDEATEVGWRHAGITAILIDLVAGRFDQHISSGRDALAKEPLRSTSGWAEQIEVMPP
jgi:hypothetical protein